NIAFNVMTKFSSFVVYITVNRHSIVPPFFANEILYSKSRNCKAIKYSNESSIFKKKIDIYYYSVRTCFLNKFF
ncbi:MAG: hypothetical protein QGF31_01525, partial [Nitrospinota bacterium]|nr:hypothetical protein [Nitrospinota bacterium]